MFGLKREICLCCECSGISLRLRLHVIRQQLQSCFELRLFNDALFDTDINVKLNYVKSGNACYHFVQNVLSSSFFGGRNSPTRA